MAEIVYEVPVFNEQLPGCVSEPPDTAELLCLYEQLTNDIHTNLDRSLVEAIMTGNHVMKSHMQEQINIFKDIRDQHFNQLHEQRVIKNPNLAQRLFFDAIEQFEKLEFLQEKSETEIAPNAHQSLYENVGQGNTSVVRHIKEYSQTPINGDCNKSIYENMKSNQSQLIQNNNQSCGTQNLSSFSSTFVEKQLPTSQQCVPITNMDNSKIIRANKCCCLNDLAVEKKSSNYSVKSLKKSLSKEDNQIVRDIKRLLLEDLRLRKNIRKMVLDFEDQQNIGDCTDIPYKSSVPSKMMSPCLSSTLNTTMDDFKNLKMQTREALTKILADFQKHERTGIGRNIIGWFEEISENRRLLRSIFQMILIIIKLLNEK